MSRYQPKLYRSETVILVVPQRVPESYVRSTVTTRIEDRLGSISPQILSRPRLEQIIQEFGLYSEQIVTQPMELVVDSMRRAIEVNVERGNAFRVGYVSGDPVIAQKVTERLASLFIEENLRDREMQAEGTNRFLDAQLDEARLRLIEHEKTLEGFRRRYAGQLPTQIQTNLQAIQSARMQLQALNESIDRDRDRRLVLERQMADLNSDDIPSVSRLVAVTADARAGTSSTAEQVEAAQARLKELELRYRPEHPDVGAAQRQVRDLQAKLEAEQRRIRTLPSPDAPPTVLSAAEVARRGRLQNLDVEIKNLDVQLSRKHAQERELQETIASYQAKVDSAPTRESELTELTRDYATLQATYTGLLAKREESKISANLERNQVGEQFKLLDPAQVPERPFSPDLMTINLLGAALGLGLGLAATALLEFLDTTFRTEGDVMRVLQLQVLATVPVMSSERERRERHSRRLVAALTAFVLLAGSVAVFAVWKLQSS